MRAKCPNCKGSGVVEVPDVEVVTTRGVTYRVFRTKGCSWNDSPCSCFGGRRAHSVENCPWRKLSTARRPRVR